MTVNQRPKPKKLLPKKKLLNKRKKKTTTKITTKYQKKNENIWLFKSRCKEIGDEVRLSSTVSLFDNTGLSSAIDRTVFNYDDAKNKVKEIRELISTGNYYADIARYMFLEHSIWYSKEFLKISPRKKKLPIAPTKTWNNLTFK